MTTTSIPTALPENLTAAASVVRCTNAFIDGRFAAARSGDRFTSVTPRDGTPIAEIASCAADDVDDAVRAARRAFEDGRWSQLHPRSRRTILQRLARLVDEHRHELALLESIDMGKPISDAVNVDMRVVMQSFDFFAEAIDKRYDEVGPSDPSVLSLITREPVGVVGAIVPWNFPLMLAAWKLAPALAVGNSVVLKPAELSSLTALRFAELAAEAGVPDGVFNVVPGFGHTAGSALARHQDVDLLCFTGSGSVGRQLLRDSADSNIKQVALELGGKSPQLVMADAPDLDRVADGIAGGIFFNQGQICSAGSRLVVHRSRYDELLDAVVARAQNWVAGDPLDPNTELGALVGEQHLQHVLSDIDAARDAGATIVTGGERAEVLPGGSYLKPTVITDVPPEATVAQEEIFGPALVVLPFDTVDEAVAIANGTKYGLAASVWTTDLSTAHSVSRAVRAGTVFVNCYDAADVSVPFGGYGQSGFGRDKSLHALDKYTQLKTTWIQL